MLIMLQMIPRALVVGRNMLAKFSIFLAVIDVLISWAEFRKHSEEKLRVHALAAIHF